METKTYSKKELGAFETEIAPFWETRILSDKTTVKICNYTEYMKHHKILRYYPDSKDYAIAGDKIKDYMETQEKIRQLSFLKSRKEFAQKKQAEEYSEME